MKTYKVNIKLNKDLQIKASSKAWVKEKLQKDIEDGFIDKDLQITIEEEKC